MAAATASSSSATATTVAHGAAAQRYMAVCERAHAQCAAELVQALDTHAKSVTLSQRVVPLRDDDVKCIAAVLRHLDDDDALRVVNLEGNHLGVDAVQALMEAIAANPHRLRELRLGKNNVRDDAAARIGRTLLRNGGCGLKVLDLSENSLTLHGVTALLEALQTPSCELVELSFHNNKLDASAGAAIAAALQRSPRLRHLHLGYNALRDGGAVPLAQSLHASAATLSLSSPLSCLSTLDLTANRIGAAGGEALIAALRSPSCRLQRLNLRRNVLPSTTLAHFADVLRENTSLIQLFLGYMSPSPADAAAVLSALRHNHTLLLFDMMAWKLPSSSTLLTLLSDVQRDNATLAAVVSDACAPLRAQLDSNNHDREARQLHPLYVGPEDRDAYLATRSLRRYSRAQSTRRASRASSTTRRSSRASSQQRRRRADSQSSHEHVTGGGGVRRSASKLLASGGGSSNKSNNNSNSNATATAMQPEGSSSRSSGARVREGSAQSSSHRSRPHRSQQRPSSSSSAPRTSDATTMHGADDTPAPKKPQPQQQQRSHASPTRNGHADGDEAHSAHKRDMDDKAGARPNGYASHHDRNNENNNNNKGDDSAIKPRARSSPQRRPTSQSRAPSTTTAVATVAPLLGELRKSECGPQTARVLGDVVDALAQRLDRQHDVIAALQRRVTALEQRQSTTTPTTTTTAPAPATSHNNKNNSDSSNGHKPLSHGVSLQQQQQQPSPSSVSPALHRSPSAGVYTSRETEWVASVRAASTATSMIDGVSPYARPYYTAQQQQQNDSRGSAAAGGGGKVHYSASSRAASEHDGRASVASTSAITTSRDVPPSMARANEMAGEERPEEAALQRSAQQKTYPPCIEPSPARDMDPPRRKSVSQALLAA